MVGRRWVVACVLACPFVWAQTQAGEVRGRVVDSRGSEPVSLVQVVLSDTPFRAVTDDDGSFRITEVPPGNYVLQAGTVGYHLVHQEFMLAAGEVKNFDVVLTSSTARRSDTVDVTAGTYEAATESSASAMTLEGQERKNLASVLSDDPLRAVQSLPGVTSNNDFSSEFSLRGAPFSRVGLYLDGVLLHSPFHTTDGQADNGSLTVFNGDMVDDMTLYQGAWPVRYSDRTAGILAVDSREGNRQQVEGRITASASNAGALLEGPLGSKSRGSWIVAFRKSYLQYILNRIDWGDQAPMAFGFTDGQAHLAYDLTPRHTLSLSYLEGSSSVDRDSWRSSLGVNAVMNSGYRFTLLNLSSRYTPAQWLLVSNHLAWTRENGDVSNRDDASLSRQAYGEWTWHGDATVTMSSRNSLDFGGMARRSRLDGAATQFIYAPDPTESPDHYRGTDSRTGVYVQHALAFAAGKVHLATGARWDSHSASTVHVVSPYASVSFQPIAATRLEADWGQYAQFPELNEYYSVFARVLLLPERATHYDVALEQRLDERTRIRVEFYNRQDRDLLARPALDPRVLADGTVVLADPNAAWRNSQRGFSRGVEIFLQRRSANGFTGWVSYAYGHAVITERELAQRYAADYDQPHTFNAYVSLRLRPTANLSGRFTYGSGMPLPGYYKLESDGYRLAVNRNSVRAPAYERTDLRLNKAFLHRHSKTTVFGEIVNITNHNNRDFDSPGPYDPATARVWPNFYSMFPILPSVGMMFEF